MAERKHVVYRNNKGDNGPPPVDKNTQAAEKHLENNEFENVVKSARMALEADPMRLRPYLQLAIAHQRLGQPEQALEAAETGVCVADKKHDKESLATAQLRRAIALFQLGRAADAALALGWAKEDECKDKSIGIWQIKIDQKKDQSTESDGFERVPKDKMPKERLVSRPVTKKPAPSPSSKVQELDDDDDEDVRQALKEKEQYKASIAAQAKKNQDFDAKNVRMDFFQNNASVNVSLFLKNVPKESCNVEFHATEAVLTCKQPTSGEPFKYVLGPLTRQIKPEESSFRVFGTKVELNLVKAAAEKWPGLVVASEREDTKPSEPVETVSLDEMRKALNEPKLPPVNGAKDWDKLAEAELEGDDAEGDNPNAFFEKLYANADEDTRRAMMKSYIESNGTSLSTDWDSVKKGKVETVPPEGMEVKSWRNN
ncbi:hypothetical protein TRICI_002042 [Trichomonascus ciferrii]|uniref:CS domain-containing protein n=1 Tax=Trichomonascus ciferrii TaxID=44093 RepID=A0A642V6X6_9ASCO|nr:hypothetical protein TRICI_002042 [Trichomonascus ciferrii]